MVDSGAHPRPPARPAGIPPLKKAAYTLVLLAIAGSAVLVGWELVERLRYRSWRARYDNFGWLGRITVASADPVLEWEYRPHARARSGRPAWLMHTNRWGFRDRDRPDRAGPEAVARVAFIGDSVTLGMLVPEPDTFVRRLEPLLGEARSAPVETLNFGVDGYDARQIRRLLEVRVVEFEPDAVVYAVSLNDFDFWESSGEKALYFDPPAIFVTRKLDRAWQRITRTDFHHYYYRKNRDVVLGEIAAMDAAARARDAGFLAAVLPVFPLSATLGDDAARLEFVDPDVLDDFSTYPFADVHEDLAARLRARGIDVVDLLDAFRADGRRPGELALDVWHPSDAGHAIIARALVEPVLGVLPPAGGSEQGVDQRRGAGGAEHDQ